MNERESALDLINDTRHLDMRLKKEMSGGFKQTSKQVIKAATARNRLFLCCTQKRT